VLVAPAKKLRHAPGEAGLWALILPDLVLFSMLFVTFLVHRRDDPVSFARSAALLDRNLGLIDTLLLLTSSLTVAIAVHRVEDGRPGARAHLVAAMGCGLSFVALKIIEYTLHIRAGITPATDNFFMFYYVMTGIHLVHVLIGLGVLLTLAIVAGRPDALARLRLIEGGACFWHVVDLLWIGLFALLYLAR